MGLRIPAIAATERTALEVNHRSQAGAIDPAAANKSMDQHVCSPASFPPSAPV